VAKSVEEVAEAMYKLVAEAQGLKKLKAMDLTKSMIQVYGDEVDKKLCKEAIKQLINSGRCVYTYFGGSYIELPHKESAAND
jgi:outer membrane protein assembly factor BamA